MKTATTTTNITRAPAVPVPGLDPFDADQRTRMPAAASLAENTPALTPRAVRVLAGIATAKAGQPQNYVEFLDLLASQIRQAGDSERVLARALAIVKAARDEDPAPSPSPCQIHAWCTETDPRHREHQGAIISAPSPDGYGNHDVLSAHLLDWGKGTTIGLLDLDLTPAEARVRIAELRAHLDNVEALVAAAETPSAGL